MNPFFTVLITAYNYGRYIDYAIQSVLAQTLSSDQFEVIIIDDGSTDDTAERVAKFGNSVRYHYQENAGQASAFNAGITFANGKFIAFLDADDLWCPEKLEHIKLFLETNSDVDHLYHSLIHFDDSGAHLAVYPKYSSEEIDAFPLDSLVSNRLQEAAPTSGIVCSSDLLKKITPIPENYRICADSYLAVVAPLVASGIVFISKPLAFYRLHDNNCYSRFDSVSGSYVCKDAKLNAEKARLDLEAIKAISSRFNIVLPEYLADLEYQFVMHSALLLREQVGVLLSIHYFYRSAKFMRAYDRLKFIYRSMSAFLRLLFGIGTFNLIASRYIGSSLHSFIHSIITPKQRQYVHE